MTRSAACAALLLLALPVPATAGAAFCAIADCYTKLLTCCPPPCPVLDGQRVAGAGASVTAVHANTDSLRDLEAQQRRWARLLGPAGPRGATQPPPSGDWPTLEQSLSVATLDPAAGSITDRLHYLRQRAVADADALFLDLQRELGRADERAALAAAPTPALENLRDALRIHAELDQAILQYRAIAASAHAARSRLAAQMHIETAAGQRRR